MTTIECRRCGTCCIKGGPVLHTEDLALIHNKIIRAEQLVVIREGEPAYNPLSDKVEPTACEMLKIQGKPGSWECLFYDAAQKSCSIHANRPLECRLLQCRDTTAILAVTGQNCLKRLDIIGNNDPVISAMQTLAECSWQQLNHHLATLDSQSITEAEKILLEDLLLREQAVNQLHLSLAQELFYFGRPMFQSINHADIQLSFENGRPRLHLLQTEASGTAR